MGWRWGIGLGSLLLGMVVSQAAESDSSVSELVERVRREEQRYQNLEYRLTDRYRNVRQLDDPELVLDRTITKRIVLQGDRYYLHWKNNTVGTDGTVSRRRAIVGFDGQTTRERGDGFARLYHERFEDSRVSRAHTMLLEYDWIHGSLAAHLAAAEFDGTRLSVELLPQMEIEGLECLGLKCVYSDPEDNTVQTVRRIWLAVERNMIPVRHVAYATNYSRIVPLEAGTVTAWQELSTGLWFPVQAKIQVFDEMLARQQIKSLSNETTIRVDSVVPDPQVDNRLFREISFEPGSQLHVLRNGEIVETKVVGGDPE